ncbi:MAG: GNAT family N-acetyltransferase [Sporolactobacillus sp.]
MDFFEISKQDITELADLFIATFNSPPWNDKWTTGTASKRLHQFINCEGFYGLKAYENTELCGMILGSEEQFYNGIVFTIKEFCVANDRRGKGIGTQIIAEFEKRLRGKGVSQLILATLREDRTEGFYRRRGFHSIETMVMMGKELNE